MRTEKWEGGPAAILEGVEEEPGGLVQRIG